MVDNSRQNKYRWTIPLLLAVCLVGGMLIGLKLQKVPLVSQEIGEDLGIRFRSEGRMEELIRFIEARYVDDVDREELIENAINQLLEDLDPHSNYISAKQLREVNEQLEGNFEGIGIEFMMLDDTIRVIAPLAGGPSESVGILAGDKIITIGDSLVAGVEMEVKDIVGKLRGKKGTKVDVGIMRGFDEELLDFEITRDQIPLHSMETAYMIDNETGYIKITRFSATTYKEFMQALNRLVEEEGMKNLVLDLRQNPGGYLQEATNMLSQLFDEKGKLLVYTEGRSVRRNDYESTGKPRFDIEDVAVLIDEGSASASEIVAGAVQDWDRGTIIGRRSFGKGLVQEQYNLKDGAALRLTVARYYTPSGRSIQKAYDDREDYQKDVYERIERGELSSQDSIQVEDTTQFFTAQGRIVYGGGGVTPDIFVPVNDIYFNDYYTELRQHIPQFVYRYAEQQGQAGVENMDDFIRTFRVDDQLMDRFLDYAEGKGAATNRSELPEIRSELELLLKARIVRHYFKEEGFYRILNERDPAVREALKAMKETTVPLATEK